MFYVFVLVLIVQNLLNMLYNNFLQTLLFFLFFLICHSTTPPNQSTGSTSMIYAISLPVSSRRWIWVALIFCLADMRTSDSILRKPENGVISAVVLLTELDFIRNTIGSNKTASGNLAFHPVARTRLTERA